MVDERGNSLNHIVLMPLLPPVFLYIFINLDLTRVLTLISGIAKIVIVKFCVVTMEAFPLRVI